MAAPLPRPPPGPPAATVTRARLTGRPVSAARTRPEITAVPCGVCCCARSRACCWLPPPPRPPCPWPPCPCWPGCCQACAEVSASTSNAAAMARLFMPVGYVVWPPGVPPAIKRSQQGDGDDAGGDQQELARRAAVAAAVQIRDQVR